MKAIEIAGHIDDEGHLHLEEPLPDSLNGPVRVIVLAPEEGDFDEREWLRAASDNPAFEFLRESAEDIYNVSDGKPFHDEG